MAKRRNGSGVASMVRGAPDVREKRGRGSRSPSPDGAIVTGRVDSPGRLRKRERVYPS
jgi:hypothetical protein